MGCTPDPEKLPPPLEPSPSWAGLILPTFQLRLTKFGGLRGIGSGLDGLFSRKYLHPAWRSAELCSISKFFKVDSAFGPPLNDLNNPSRFVRAHIVADYYVGCL